MPARNFWDRLPWYFLLVASIGVVWTVCLNAGCIMIDRIDAFPNVRIKWESEVPPVTPLHTDYPSSRPVTPDISWDIRDIFRNAEEVESGMAAPASKGSR